MANPSRKQREAALNSSTATIGDNSNADIATKAAALATIKTYGENFRSDSAKAETAQLNAGITFGRAVKAGTLDIEADLAAVVNAWNPKLSDDSKKQLRTQFKSFALPEVRDSVDYDIIEKADGKSLFQTALSVNRAVKADYAAQKPGKGKDGKAKPKVLPVVDAAFIAAALDPDKPGKAPSETTLRNRAIKKLVDALAEFKNAKMIAAAKEDLKAAQINAIRKLFEALTKEEAA